MHSAGVGRLATVSERIRLVIYINGTTFYKRFTLWNDIPADIKLCKSMFTFKKMYKALLLQPYQFG